MNNQWKLYKQRANKRNFICTDNFQHVFDIPRLPVEITKKILINLYSRGVIPKSKLKDKAVYLGKCRNAYNDLARWDKEKNHFIYWRVKFNDVFEEPINHFEDEDGYDVFVPIKRVRKILYKEPKVKED